MELRVGRDGLFVKTVPVFTVAFASILKKHLSIKSQCKRIESLDEILEDFWSTNWMNQHDLGVNLPELIVDFKELYDNDVLARKLVIERDFGEGSQISFFHDEVLEKKKDEETNKRKCPETPLSMNGINDKKQKSISYNSPPPPLSILEINDRAVEPSLKPLTPPPPQTIIVDPPTPLIPFPVIEFLEMKLLGKSRKIQLAHPCYKSLSSTEPCLGDKCDCTKYIKGLDFDAETAGKPWDLKAQPAELATLQCTGVPIFCYYCYFDLKGNSCYLNDRKSCLKVDSEFGNAPKDASAYCFIRNFTSKKFWRIHNITQREGMWRYIVVQDYLNVYLEKSDEILQEYRKDYQREIDIDSDMLHDLEVYREWAEDIIGYFDKGVPIPTTPLLPYLAKRFQWTSCRRSHPVLVLKGFNTKCKTCKTC